MQCAVAIICSHNLLVSLVDAFAQDPTTGEVKPKPSQEDPAKSEDALRSVADDSESVLQEPHNTPTVTVGTVGSEREEKVVV